MIAVGRISKLFGSQGEVYVVLYNNFPTDFKETEQPVFTNVDGLVVPLFCSSFSRRGQSSAVILFDDIDNPRRAELIIGKEIFLDIEEQEDEEDVSLSALIGYKVVIGNQKGEIVDFYDSVNPLFEIELNSKKYLIPAVEEFIVDFKPKQKVLYLELPEGLLDL